MKRDPRDATRRPTAADLQDDPRPPALETEFRGEDFPEVRFDPEEFEGLLNARGVGCVLRKAIRCPCLRVETGQPRAGCPVCGGVGFAYPLELEEPIVALVLNRSPRRSQMPVGQEVTGTCAITFPVGVIPSQGDMILPDNEEHAVQQVLRRSIAQVDPQVVRDRQTAPDQRAPVVAPTTERLLYPDVIRIEHLFWIDESGQLKRGEEGRDFTRRANIIEFRPERGPAPGKAFTVRYRAPAAYVVSPGEPVARTGEVGFPYRCDGQRLDRWGVPDLR